MSNSYFLLQVAPVTSRSRWRLTLGEEAASRDRGWGKVLQQLVTWRSHASFSIFWCQG